MVNTKVIALLSAGTMIVKHMLNQLPDLDRLFQALADPARRAMVERLSRGPAPVSELARPLPMSLPAAMQHLGVLEAAGLVRSKKIGRVRTCSIQPLALSLAEQWINARRAEWEDRLDRLGDYLKTLENEGDDNGQDK
jgi:DNA-binding transcriptional ArsR family regulator